MAIVAAWKRRYHVARKMMVAIIVAVACVAPWTLRNRVTFDRFIPIASNAGYAYFAGNLHWRLGEQPADRTGGLRRRALRLAGIDAPFEEVVHFMGIRDPKLAADIDARAKADALEHLPQFATKVFLNGIEFYFPVVHPLLIHTKKSVPARILQLPGKTIRSGFYLLLWVLAVSGFLRLSNSYQMFSVGFLFLAIALYSMREAIYDIAIIGGGLVGASLACALAPLGFRIAMVEADG